MEAALPISVPRSSGLPTVRLTVSSENAARICTIHFPHRGMG